MNALGSTFITSSWGNNHPPSRRPAFNATSATKLIEQQMYFWGADVLSPQGNLLTAWGCQKFRSEQADHRVHFYQYALTHTRLLLHSTGAQLHLENAAEEESIAYLRPYHRLFRSEPGAPPPLPASGKRLPEGLRSLRPQEVTRPLIALLRLVRDYEKWVGSRLNQDNRMELWREFQKVPKAIRWLPPEKSATWLDEFLNHHPQTTST